MNDVAYIDGPWSPDDHPPHTEENVIGTCGRMHGGATVLHRRKDQNGRTKLAVRFEDIRRASSWATFIRADVYDVELSESVRLLHVPVVLMVTLLDPTQDKPAEWHRSRCTGCVACE